MKRIWTAALCALLGAGQAMAAPPQDDDWEFQQDPAQNLMIAAVRYEAGAAIVVQCRAGALTAVVAGLTPSATDLQLQAARADGRRDIQAWAPAGPGVYRSETAARDIRFMRGGGLYSLRSAEGAATRLRADFDLPTQSANLDRVLTGCGWALTDDRDQLARVGSEVSFRDPNAPAGPTTRSRTRARAQGGGRPERTSDGPPPAPVAETQKSCIIRDLRLTECRADHPPAPGARPSRTLEWLEGRRIYAPDAAAVEGRVMITGDAPVIVIIREEL